MGKFKRISLVILIFSLVIAVFQPVTYANTAQPIARGRTNKVTQVYWGKGELYPILGTLNANSTVDIYEYDKTWVLTQYEMYVTYMGTTSSQSFWGYVKRSDITSSELKGNESPAADRGPGKRKGKPAVPKPKNPNEKPSEREPHKLPDELNTPDIEVEDMTEYDWIIRTPGVCRVVIDMGDGVKFVARFGLMSTKFGGYTASSLPVYNDGVRNPYVGYMTFSLQQSMQEMLQENSIDFLQGFGGVSIEASANNARFTIDSEYDDAVNTIISIPANTVSVLDPKIVDQHTGLTVGGEFFRDEQVIPFDMKLEKSGTGYRFVLLNMRPGGGDLRFPAMLEKIPLSDMDKAERERIKKERKQREAEERIKKAQELLKRLTDELVEEMRRQRESDLEMDPNPNEEPDTDLAPLAPLIPVNDEGDLAPLATLVPKDNDDTLAPLAPLVPINNDDELAPLAPLVPLTGGGTSETPDFFPDPRN